MKTDAVKAGAPGTGGPRCPPMGQGAGPGAETKNECRERPGKQAARKGTDRPRMVQRLHIGPLAAKHSAFVGYDGSHVT